VCKIAIVAVVIMIVAIPEGLHLSIQLAMSFSVSKLKKENILIKNMNAIQKMAMCHEVCISKTGCLTTGEMFVDKYQLLDGTDIINHDSFG
jgi:P-type E1-E2 ATPase